MFSLEKVHDLFPTNKFMASITLKELVKLIQSHPNYMTKWELGVPAEQALYIKLDDQASENLESEVFEGIQGSEIVIDKDTDGRVHGIEII